MDETVARDIFERLAQHPGLLDFETARAVLGVSVSTMRRMVAANQVKFYRVRNRLRFDGSDLADFLKVRLA